jgi:2-(3-amino-3-carboxypropyl)histidine synthase
MDVEIDRQAVMEWLAKTRPRAVLLQGPLGLRRFLESLAEEIYRIGVQPFISSSPTWGGCDLAIEEAKRLGAQAIIHLGHAPFLSNSELPVLYIEARYRDYKPLRSLLEKISEELSGYKSIGLGMSVQWLNHLDQFAADLESLGFKVHVSAPSGHLAHRGQVLGCDYSTLKSIEGDVDCFLVVGSVFHALGIALISVNPTLAVDPLGGGVKWVTERARQVLSTRYGLIEKARKARKIGIIVSRKPGQMMLGLANRLKTLLEAAGYFAHILITDEVVSEELADFSFDAYVNTACPRLSIEDQARFGKPLLLPSEVMVMLGKLSWEELVEGGILFSLDAEETLRWSRRISRPLVKIFKRL